MSLFGSGPCRSCEALQAQVRDLQGERDTLQSELRHLHAEHTEILFRITRLKQEQRDRPAGAVGGFEPLRARRARLEKESRIRAAGAATEKGWKEEALDKEVLEAEQFLKEHAK